jgi:RNA polymerase sigma factor for flagellar operon FliA
MMEALDRFDPVRGVRFRTFAARRMHGAILNGLETMTEKQQQIAVRQRLRRERLASLTEAESPATPPNVATSLKGDELFRHLADIGIGLALSFLLEGTGMFDGGELPGHNPANDTYYRRTEVEQLRRRMLEHIDHLKPQARQVIRGHYVQEIPFDEIARMMGVTKGRVSQIHREALQMLRTMLRDTGTCDTQL